MTLIYTAPRKITRIGRSLSFEIPSYASQLLGVGPDTRVYAYADRNRIVYFLGTLPPTLKAGVEVFEVKPRVQARFNAKQYYELTIPAKLARQLGIREGSQILVKCYKDRITVEPLGE